jgi:hypothetical protein
LLVDVVVVDFGEDDKNQIGEVEADLIRVSDIVKNGVDYGISQFVLAFLDKFLKVIFGATTKSM